MNSLRFSMRVVILALTTTLCASVSSELRAQNGPFERVDGTRIAVTLVLTATGEAPVLLRRPGGEAHNVILIDSTTVDAQQLSDAVFQLLVLEAQDPRGERRAHNAASRVRADVPHPAYPWAEAAIRRLRTSEPQAIPGVTRGRGQRVLQIWMPPLRGVTRRIN
jgi:hypothetical protein